MKGFEPADFAHRVKMPSVSLYFLFFAIRLTAQTLPFSIGDWPPYTGEDLPNRGIATEIVEAAARSAGFEPTFSSLPWRRAEAGVESGHFFATFPFIATAQRSTEYLFSSVIFTSRFVIARRALTETPGEEEMRIEGFPDASVGVVAGTDAVILPLREAGARVTEVQTTDQLVRLLVTGRIDFAVDDELTLQFAIARAGVADKTFISGFFGESREFRVMASRAYPDAEGILVRFEEGLARIREEGTLGTILEGNITGK